MSVCSANATVHDTAIIDIKHDHLSITRYAVQRIEQISNVDANGHGVEMISPDWT